MTTGRPLAPVKPPPLPPIWDPAKAVDKPPQPFRMIDKVLAEIVERSLDLCLAKDKQKRVFKATHVDTIFSPHATLIADGNASCFATVGVAGMAVVGTTTGTLYAHAARDPLMVGQHQAHESAITAMDTGHIAAMGAKVVASASRGRLAVHEVVIKTSELRQLTEVELPGGEGGAAEAPAGVSLSTNAGHVAVWWPSGAVAVYEVNLPDVFYQSVVVEPGPEAPPPDLSGGKLHLVLHFSTAVVKALLVDSSFVGCCNIVWQQQQRPDKSGKSDRNHRPARGIYIYWTGCSKLTLSYLDDTPPPPTSKPPPPPEPAQQQQQQQHKPGTPRGQGSSAKQAGSRGGSRPQISLAVAAPEEPSSKPEAPGVRHAPSKGWLLPMGITCSAVSENGKVLAFGMDDGTVLVWDDHFGGHTKILPRMPAAVSAVAFVNGAFNLVFATSMDGSVYLADLSRPEDSHMSRTKLPTMAIEVHFLPNDPFAICVCPGDEEHHPRLVWFDMMEEKLGCELSGKTENGFGRAGMAGQLAGAGDSVPKQAQPSVPTESKGGDSSAPSLGSKHSAGAGAAAAAAAAAPPASTPRSRAAAAAAAASAAAEAALAPPPPPPLPAGIEGGAAVAGAAQGQGSEAGNAEQEPSPTTDVPPQLRALNFRAMLWPRISVRDSYLVVGGPTPTAAAPLRPAEAFRPGDKPPIEAHLYLFKVDAIARMLLPEEMASTSSKSLLDRMLADLDPPHKRSSRVKMGVEDPDALKPPPSAMRPRPGELQRLAEPSNMGESTGERRHIKFNEADLAGLLNEEGIAGKQFKKEKRSGGYSDGHAKKNELGKLDLSKFLPAKNTNLPPYMQERPVSPPWHHTNPMARIHPDWEEAPVLCRTMDRIGTKGGGRRRRDRKTGQVISEMKSKMAREAGPKPNLLFNSTG